MTIGKADNVCAPANGPYRGTPGYLLLYDTCLTLQGGGTISHKEGFQSCQQVGHLSTGASTVVITSSG
ncbi:hypothetical protein CHS0354_042531 [Potamilus streckersoni]|uniref:Uncharacterized protein n=1 Tax=Potamilus streckersoni TaxID=2493646 RepID=A0AAE0TEN1_9BIVA|nr:hypothetical protein CHS0354_042531 [Potamilus streckersoni]